ncbi:DNA binding protein [Aureococcus anophagefferens]|nr:DNA binding protein [Aureococcus anophagefferens]
MDSSANDGCAGAAQLPAPSPANELEPPPQQRKRPKREPRPEGVVLVGADDTSVLLKALDVVSQRFPALAAVAQAPRTGDALQRLLRAKKPDVRAGAAAASDGAAADAALAVVDGYAERCCFEAGTVAMKRIAEACMARNRDPLCPWPYRPTLSKDRGRDRDYEFLAGGYAAFPGADAAQAASVRAALAVQNVPPGVVVSPYAVDDDSIGDAWRKEYVADGDVDQDALVVASVVDAMAAETARRACAAEAAAMNPTFEPLACGPGRAVDEVAAVGLDCYARRAVELACEFCGVPGDAGRLANDSLIPALRRLAANSEKPAPATLTAAAVACGDAAEDPALRFACAAVVGFARWLGSDGPFRARAKGTGVVVTRPGGLRAHEYVCDYLGEVYPPYRWLEKLAAVTSCRREVLGRAAADAHPAPEAFHNIALERPQADPRGYGLYFVDAGGDKANWASSCSHSCDGNLQSSVFAKPGGALSVALHTSRPVRAGEELCFDYSACTSSEREWRDANDAAAAAALARHGFRDAFFEKAGDARAAWLDRYVGELVGFLEFERGQLPYALLRMEKDFASAAKKTAASRARLVLEQRVQALACAVSVARRVCDLRGVAYGANAPPLEVLGAAGTADALLSSLRDLAAFGADCADAELRACVAVDGDPSTRQEAKAALLAIRRRLLAYAALEKPAACPPCAKKPAKKARKQAPAARPSALEAAACAADAILLTASTATFVRVAERPAVAAAPVDVKKKEVGNLRHGDTAAPQYRACDRLRDDDVVLAPARTYGPFAEVEALLCWHDLDALAEPALGDGGLAFDNLRGCGLCPDAAAIRAPPRRWTRRSGRRRRRRTRRATTRPRGASSASCSETRSAARLLARDAALFFPDGAAREPRLFGSPALDGALESNFASVDACVAELLGSAAPAVSASASPRAVLERRRRRDALAEAMPDRPPSRWVACDACEKWRLVPWHADFDDAGDEPFFCKDQVKWGAPAAEACCDFPEPTWGEDDMVFECSTLDVDALVTGAKVDARCAKTGVWFGARVVSLKRAGDAVDVGLHFMGWHKKFDEVFQLPRDKEKLAPHRTFSAANREAQLNAQGSKKTKKAKAPRKKAKAPAAAKRKR